MKIIAILALLSYTLVGCSDRLEIYYIASSRGDGIYKGMPVLSKGKKIGAVTGLGVTFDKAIIEVSLEKDFRVCHSSKISVVRENPFKTAIEITNACGKASMLPGDTISAEVGATIKRIPIEISKERIDSLKALRVKKKLPRITVTYSE